MQAVSRKETISGKCVRKPGLSVGCPNCHNDSPAIWTTFSLSPEKLFLARKENEGLCLPGQLSYVVTWSSSERVEKRERNNGQVLACVHEEGG